MKMRLLKVVMRLRRAKLINYWVHNSFVATNDEKMSKLNHLETFSPYVRLPIYIILLHCDISCWELIIAPLLIIHIWAVDRLRRLGISRYFQQEIEECVDYVHRQ